MDEDNQRYIAQGYITQGYITQGRIAKNIMKTQKLMGMAVEFCPRIIT